MPQFLFAMGLTGLTGLLQEADAVIRVKGLCVLVQTLD